MENEFLFFLHLSEAVLLMALLKWLASSLVRKEPAGYTLSRTASAHWEPGSILSGGRPDFSFDVDGQNRSMVNSFQLI